MAPSCASSVPPLIGDYPRCRAAAWQAAPTLPLGLSVAAASLGTEASLPVDMPGGREGLEGDTDAQGSARRRSGLAHTSTRRVATPRFPVSKSSLCPLLLPVFCVYVRTCGPPLLSLLELVANHPAKAASSASGRTRFRGCYFS